jgi:hypothetical protein
MTGYFLCQMEKRMDLEDNLSQSDSLNNRSNSQKASDTE